MQHPEVNSQATHPFPIESDDFPLTIIERKYDYQIGIGDLDFSVDEEKITQLGIKLPLQNIQQAEEALQNHLLSLNSFAEEDHTKHKVLIFDPRPIGYSGFYHCVTHSLILSDLGLFEIGRFSAISITSENRQWQWFLHRRLASPDEVNQLMEDQMITAVEFVKVAFRAMTNTD